MHDKYRRLITKMIQALVFVDHIERHLKPGQEIVCKVCGKSISEIFED